MRKAALITGGTRGIGFGVARRLALERYDLALCGTRAPADVEPSLEPLRSAGAEVHYIQADVGDRRARERLVAEARSRLGRLNLFVSNAGVAPRERRDILDATEESFDWVLGINLRGPYFLAQAAARWMIEQKGADAAFAGCIVFVTSISAAVASTNRGEYCISKAGLAMASALWAVRLAEFGIPVYEVRPGIVATDMTAGVREKYDKLIGEGLLLERRWGVPEDVGRAIAMLARGDLPYATGHVLTLDGGMGLPRL